MMMSSINPHVKYLIIVSGPTAVGKTGFSISLAKKINTVIVSADSRQFYKEMQIGTAAPSAKQLKIVKHHFIGFLSVKENYTAWRYEQDATALLDELFKTHNIVVMTGGSGLFINAVCHGLDKMPETDKELRNQLEKLLANEGIAALQKQLLEKDPVYYKQADISNSRRIIRALEVCISTGKPFSSFRIGVKKKRNFKYMKIGLAMERERLYARINTRVDNMMKKDLLKEAKALYPFREYNALQTVGYKELFDHFDGKYNLEKAIELIKQNTRRYAKRQMTWLRKDDEIKWIEGNEADILKVAAAHEIYS